MPDIKKQLKQLQLGDWSSFIEDVNYNFSVLISSPLFLGTEGGPGKGGTPGTMGLRGSRWFYINLDLFKAEFPNDNLIGEYQITIDYLNNKLLNQETKSKLIKCFNIDTFVSGDIIICNSKIYMLDLTVERSIVDTGNIINSSAEIIQSDIINSVSTYIDQRILELGQSIELSYNTLYQTHAKNFTDSSGSVNNEIKDNSIYDILTTDSKAGTKVLSHMTLAPRETLLNGDMTMTQIVGSAEKYHQLIQKTIDWDQNQSNNTTSEFGPSKKSNPSLVILQNDYTNGLMIGNRNEDRFTYFGKMFIAINNSKKNLTITGPNVSGRNVSYSHIKIYDEQIDITSYKLNLKGETVANGNFTMLSKTTFEHPSMKVTDTELTIGSLSGAGTKTLFNSSTHTFEHSKYLNADFLSIVNKELIPNKNTLDKNVDYTKITGSLSAVPNTQLIKNLWDALNAIDGTTGTSLTALQNALQQEITNRTNADNTINTKINNLIGGSTYNLKTLETYLTTLVNTTDTARKTYIDNRETIIRSDYDTKITNVKNYADSVNTALSLQINTLNTNLTTETTNRINADTAIRGGYAGSMQNLYTLITNETTNRTNADTEIRGGYAGSMNDLHKLILGNGIPGTIIDLYVSSTELLTTVVSTLFDANGRGKTNVSYETPVGSAKNINLSNLYICDGKGGRPDLRGYVTIMPETAMPLVPSPRIGNKIGKQYHKIGKYQIPEFDWTIPSWAFFSTLPDHNHSIRKGDGYIDSAHLSMSESGNHYHRFSYAGDGQFGDAEREFKSGLVGVVSTNNDTVINVNNTDQFRYSPYPSKQTKNLTADRAAGMQYAGLHQHVLSFYGMTGTCNEYLTGTTGVAGGAVNGLYAPRTINFPITLPAHTISYPHHEPSDPGIPLYQPTVFVLKCMVGFGIQ